MNCLFCHGILYCHDIHGKFWFAAHGIDITDCIAGGNLSEKVRIIRNRRKKINRLYDCGIIIDFIYRCIITFVEAAHPSEPEDPAEALTVCLPPPLHHSQHSSQVWLI